MENFSKYKIMILGYLEAKNIDVYINLARDYGVSSNALVFITDPNHFKLDMIRNSDYTDLFLSCTPHSLQGVNEKNLIRKITKRPEIYPKLQTTAALGQSFKTLSVSNFQKFLINSKYFKVVGLTGVRVYKEEKEVKKQAVVNQPETKLSKKPRHGTTYKNFLERLTKEYS